MSGTPSFSGRGPVRGQGASAERVLRALPGWFGIEASIVEYVRATEKGPTFVAEAGDGLVGFLTVRATSVAAVEVHVMAVLPSWHRNGVGRALVERAARYARERGASVLHVKTLAPSDPDAGYARTRAFYEAVGFVPVEVLEQVWGPENPCLIMVRPLAG